MRHVVLAAAERAAHPGVDQVEGQRRVHADASDAAPTAAARRGSARRRRTRRPCRSAAAARARPLQVSTWRSPTRPVTLTCSALDRRIDVAHRAAGRALLAQHVPGLERQAQFDLDAARAKSPSRGKRNSRCGANQSARAGSRSRSAPRARRARSCQTKCGSMKRSCSSVPQRFSRAGPVRLLPEARHQRAHQQLLRQAHARVRRHLEGAHLEQAEAPGRRRRASTACRCRTRRGACCR